MKKKTVLSHCVVKPRPHQNQSVQATKCLDHNGDCHGGGGGGGGDLFQDSSADAVILGVSDAALNDRAASFKTVERQGAQIGDIREQIQRDNEPCAHCHAQREISLRVFRFTGGES